MICSNASASARWFGQPALSLRQLRAAQQLGHAHDAVHGRRISCSSAREFAVCAAGALRASFAWLPRRWPAAFPIGAAEMTVRSATCCSRNSGIVQA